MSMALYAKFGQLSFNALVGGSQAGADDFFELGQKALSEGEPELAERSFRRATRLSPLRREFHNVLGRVAYENGRPEEALKSFEAALDIKADDPLAMVGTAAALQAMRMDSEAIFYYLSYLRRRPTDVPAIINLGAAYESTGQLEEAQELFERACELEVDNPEVHGSYGRFLYAQGRIEEAVGPLRRAAELGSPSSEVHRMLGLALISESDFEAAVEALDRAVELDPHNAAALIDLSTVLTDWRKLDRGLEYAERAALLAKQGGQPDGERASAFWQLGWVHYRLGNWQESAQASREALQIQPHLIPVRFNLGLALLRGGQVDEARAEYVKALEVVDDAWELKAYGIHDLAIAVSEQPDLTDGQELLELLRQRHRELSARRAPLEAR